ncbi:4Fe-4S dicluster domain-containing protein [Eggerthellaceae bacterium zg-1084]|uniref:4Fe-4S dicluster domain-containing protein n=2 Tax=Berryella wangjianweii TaxID=2734634 RepID=A0A6M8J477_9ACTN|nr:4Fe-4S dicluster domain-containing protein [Berryella wangjianweii]NPD30782.1 4Fe-4S dicluster domain-containing protein [Berryella wangjianweii]NPD31999.1 4Fe-4S dicluster domain-containing protein [Eggerthellaceae bacterium zg-997]QKF07413.1 4Fe-4S dicluster domain-containing protein [Berryella wangjianweii]
MAACLEKHDVPNDVAAARLNLVTTLAISAPVACRHCSDAPCAAVCPTNALYRDGGRVAVEPKRCIGCRGCVMACPFGAIDVVTRDVVVKLGNLAIQGHQKPTVVKCDLCFDRPGGPACIEACPTKGLVLVDGNKLTENSKEKRRAAALASACMSTLPINENLAV